MRRFVFLPLLGVLLLLCMGAAYPTAARTPFHPPHAATTLVGYLVGTTQRAMPPATVLVQTERGTILVAISPQTQLVNRLGAPITLGDLGDGQRVQVHGDDAGGLVNAAVFTDLSLPQTVVLRIDGIFKGAPRPSVACVLVTNVTTQPSKAAPVAPPCPVGQLAVSITANTTIIDRLGNLLVLTRFVVGDLVIAHGQLINGQFTASVLQDRAQPLVIRVDGLFKGTPRPSVACVLVTSVLTQPAQAAPVAPPCPVGQLAVSITADTKIVDRLADPIALAQCVVGDLITARGQLINGRFTASVLRDRSLPRIVTTLSGWLVGTPSSTTLLLQVGARTVQVVVGSPTRLIDRLGAPITLGDLRNGQRVRVTGTFDGTTLEATVLRDLSLPLGPTVRVQGQVGGASRAAVLCLVHTVVGAVSAATRAALGAVCPVGQLPLYLRAQTSVVDRWGRPLARGQVLLGDRVAATAIVADGRLMATLLRDLAR